MSGSGEINCDLVDERRTIRSARRMETYRSQKAQQKADEATLQQLIESSRERLASEALAALQRLLANRKPEGMRVRILLRYRDFRIGILRRLFKRKEVTVERTIWQIPYAGNTLMVLLMSDGRLYDDWCVQRSIVDGGPLLANLSSICSLNTSKQIGLFVSPRRVRIERHVSQIVHRLRQFGT